VNAYVESMTRLAEARLSELRRSAQNERLARSLGADRVSRRAAAGDWLRLRLRPARVRPMAEAPTPPVSLPTAPAAETPLRRSA
jgi:hypothetical protein